MAAGSRVTSRWRILLDTVVVLLLGGYILLGTQEVPLHGDESTTIWMSKDFDTVVLNQDMQAIYYEPPPRRTTEQHLRVITMNFSKLGMGTAWFMTSFQAEDINEQWVWSPELDISWQHENGHMPSDKLLFVTRLSSVLMTIISVALVLATARQMLSTFPPLNTLSITTGSWLAVGLYALNPAVLINGRRAMFEGGFLLGIALVGWVSVSIIRRYPYFRQRDYMLLGIVSGLALTTKHSAAFTVTILYISLLVLPLLNQPKMPQIMKQTTGIAAAALSALLLMFALTPIWWSAPLEMPNTVIKERREVLDLQVELFGGYDTVSERLSGLWRESIAVPAQYYEADYWSDFAGVDAEIDAYENQNHAGMLNDQLPLWELLRGLLLGVGMIASILYWLTLPKVRLVIGLIALWLVGIVVVTLITVPLGWQRYYLPLQIPLSLLMGLGSAALAQLGAHLAQA